MAKINCKCGNCGSVNLNVRTSESIGMRSGSALYVCAVCQSRQQVMWEIVKLETPNYKEREEFLRASKPLNQIDPRQIDFIPVED